jgi:quercetin dioxygenase-like cupin family protein
MDDYTVVSLKEVEDQAVKYGHSPSMEARFARQPLGAEDSALSYTRLAPGFRVPWGHKHRQQEEIYVVLSGRVTARVGGDTIELRPFDALRVSPQTPRGFEAGPEGAEMLAFATPRVEPLTDDVEMLPGWWGDEPPGG